MARRLIRIALASDFAPEQALLAVRDDERPFALVGDWAGGGALVGSEPVRVLDAGEDPLDVLDEQPAVDPGDAAAGAVGGGWVGWLGYAVGGLVEWAPPPPRRPVPVAPASLAFYDHLLRLDGDGRWWFEALWSDADAARLQRRCGLLAARLTGEAPRARAYRCGDFAASPSAPGHAEAVRRCREYIAAGDLYQANLTLRLEAAFAGEAIDLFAASAQRLRPARGAFVTGADAQVASLSPELFLERRAREVRTAPIKGTVARTGAPGEAEALQRSAKDAAEHVMIVDLMRNDLGRVAEYGSVRAPAAPRAEEHPGVWHLVSDVTATLRDDVGDGALLRATFPPGSVTGAPKIKALEVISTLESTAREVYTGAIGFCSPVAGLELSVAIRTFEVAGGRVWLGAGGGIVADSDPEAELRESLVKARPLLAAAGARLAQDADSIRPAQATRVPPPTRRARPDPALGLIETLLAADGVLVDERSHVARLDASLRALTGRPLPHGTAARARAAAAGLPGGFARVRIHAHAAGIAVTAEPVAADRIAPREPTALTPLTVPGGLGPHKWADRRLVAAPAPGHEPLLVDLDGAVLESGWGNVFAVEADALVTPPADGRILAGVTRTSAIAAARREGLRVVEERLTLDRLGAADELLVTSAIRSVQAAHLAGAPAPAEPGPVAARLTATLAQRRGLQLTAAAC